MYLFSTPPLHPIRRSAGQIYQAESHQNQWRSINCFISLLMDDSRGIKMGSYHEEKHSSSIPSGKIGEQ